MNLDDRAGQPGRFIQRISVGGSYDADVYPFNLPVVEFLADDGLELPAGVSFFVGENGSGKSTLIEAIAVAVGLNAEGGSQNYRFETRSTESDLADHLFPTWGPLKPRSRFFLRAESYYNVATATEDLGPEQLDVFGGVSPHERSHGESFVDLIRARFFPGGLYVMDEPEAALSPQGCLNVMALVADLVAKGSQFLIATHSPILLALPGAAIFAIDDDGRIDRVDYDDAPPVRLTRDFLAAPERYLRHLMSED
ncbi:MAG: AAA family ATPase [Gordonia sp. (in: high G+C Gram-positive bacteria)]|uniref:AAA family ATPase n=1 Tax=Gordonia sp. (in: high G+C Gram-positive bacteria) TaxID=84139 RepID=UPI0039E5F27D